MQLSNWAIKIVQCLKLYITKFSNPLFHLLKIRACEGLGVGCKKAPLNTKGIHIMKSLPFAISALAFTILSANVAATEQESAYITGGANLFIFDDEASLDDELGPWGGFGYQFNQDWAGQLDYNFVSTQPDNGLVRNTDADVSLLSLSGIRRFAPLDQDSFLAKAGLGRYKADTSVADSTETALRIGGGYEVHFTPQLAATFMMDVIYGLDEKNLDYMPNVGLKYLFNSPTTTATPAPAAPVVATSQPVAELDSDNDGVVDSFDQCPQTPAGAPVDSQGCALDSDGDGVADYLDQCADTPAGAKVDESGCRVQLEQKVSITLNVQFANNSEEVSASYRQEIQQVADFMKQYPDTSAKILGYTDALGAASYNQNLSQRRANAVAAYLTQEFGVDASRLTAEGRGEADPIADNATSEGRAQNRRVVAEIETTVKVAQ